MIIITVPSAIRPDAGIIPVTTGSGTPIISGKTGTIQVSTIAVTLAVSTNRSVKIPSPKR